MKESYDAIIIGGGPAGVSCAAWLKMMGYHPCLIEQRPHFGGLQNDSPYPNPWLPVFPDLATTGEQAAKYMHNHMLALQISFYLNTSVSDVHIIENGFDVYLSHPIRSMNQANRITAPYLVIATGVKPVTAGFYEDENILIGPGKSIFDYSFSGKKIAILGGGDNAFENYEFIQQQKPKLVHLYTRQDAQHKLKVRHEFLKRVPSKDIYSYQGNLTVNQENKIINGLQYDTIIVLYGWHANLPNLSFPLKLKENGFIQTHSITAETSQSNVYAIGEVAKRAHPCCITAMKDGVDAAKAIQDKFEK